MMAKSPIPHSIAAGLTAPQRLSLFCLASDIHLAGREHHPCNRAANAGARVPPAGAISSFGGRLASSSLLGIATKLATDQCIVGTLKLPVITG